MVTRLDWADIARGRPVRPDTLFLLASVSKTVTATALLQLADRGRIRGLDDRINGYLPASLQVANPHCGKHNKGVITFRQLLTHTASILDPPDLDVPRAFAGDDAAQVDPTKLGKDLRTYLTPRGSSWRNGRHFDRGHCPGEKYRYSNVGTTLLGYLVQEIAGTSFIEFTKTNIFAPLGMTETSWNLRDLPDHSRIATPYETTTAASTRFLSTGNGTTRTGCCVPPSRSSPVSSTWSSGTASTAAGGSWTAARSGKCAAASSRRR